MLLFQLAFKSFDFEKMATKKEDGQTMTDKLVTVIAKKVFSSVTCK